MKSHIGYNIKSNVMEFKCHSLQWSKIFGEKTKTHHDVINKTEEQE